MLLAGALWVLMACGAAAQSQVTFFTNGAGWALNGSTNLGGPAIVSNQFLLTDGLIGQSRSGWYVTPVSVGSFTARFLYENVGGTGEADGVAFVLQNDGAGTNALGYAGGSLGYESIGSSVAVLLNIFDSSEGRGIQVATGGVMPTNGYVSVAPVNLESGHPIEVTVNYASGVLETRVRDLVTLDEFTTNFVVDVEVEVGSGTALVGFTGATGGATATQAVSEFYFGPLNPELVTFFTNGTDWTLNGNTNFGGPVILTNRFSLTDGVEDQVRSGWYNVPVPVGSFDVSFLYENVGGNGEADGVAFVLQNDGAGTNALGSGGGGLGYEGLQQSVALLINIFEPAGGRGLKLGTNGVVPSGDCVSVAPVDLVSGNPILVRVRYSGGVLHVVLKDTVTEQESEAVFNVDVPGLVGSGTALVGVTGATGGLAASQTIADFSFRLFVSGGTELAGWRALQGLPANGSQDTGNPSGDGVVNLLKFAFNLAPNSGDLAFSRVDIMSPSGSEGLPLIERDNEGRLVVQFIRRKPSTLPGVRYVVETGPDLLNLQPLSLSDASTDSIDADWERVTVTDPATTPERFGRVRVVVLP